MVQSCIWYDFVSYSQLMFDRTMREIRCIWYDFVSYSQRLPAARRFPIVVYDTILSAIHNSSSPDAAAAALYMIRFCQLFTTARRTCQTSPRCIWYDFVSYFKERWCKDKHYDWYHKIIIELFKIVFPFSFGILSKTMYICKWNHWLKTNAICKQQYSLETE